MAFFLPLGPLVVMMQIPELDLLSEVVWAGTDLNLQHLIHLFVERAALRAWPRVQGGCGSSCRHPEGLELDMTPACVPDISLHLRTPGHVFTD